MENQANQYSLQSQNTKVRFGWEYIKGDKIRGFDFDKKLVLLDQGREFNGKPVYIVVEMDPADIQVLQDAFLDWQAEKVRQGI